MGFEVDLDLGGATIDRAENSGFLDQPGWYKAVCESVGLNEKGDSLQFKFRATEKPHRGMTCNAFLTMPEWVSGEDQAETAKNRLTGWFKRLGIIDRDPPPGKARYDLSAAVGRECVLNLKKRTWKDQKTGEQREKVDVDFMGVYELDHPRIPVDVRKTLNLPPARADKDDGPGTATTPASGPRRPAPTRTQDYGDL